MVDVRMPIMWKLLASAGVIALGIRAVLADFGLARRCAVNVTGTIAIIACIWAA